MKIKNKYLKLKKIYKINLLVSFLLSFSVCAQPIIIDGAVPNEITKQEILSKLYSKRPLNPTFSNSLIPR